MGVAMWKLLYKIGSYSIKKFIKIYWMIFTVPFVVYVYNFYKIGHGKDAFFEVSSIVSLISVLVLLLIIFLARLFYGYFSKHPGEKSDKCYVFPQNICTRLKEPWTFQIKIPEDYDVSNFTFATDKEMAEISARLNMDIFSRSVWKDALSNKIHRNYSHIVKNNKTVLIVYDYIPDKSSKTGASKKPRGFTHVLPVTERVWNLYKDGYIKDLEFEDSFIVASDSARRNKEVPYGIILFSMGSYHKNDFAERYEVEKDNIQDKFLKTMLVALCYHIYRVVTEFFPAGSVIPVLIQTERKSFIRILSDNNNAFCHKTSSSDGCPLFEIYIKISDTN